MAKRHADTDDEPNATTEDDDEKARHTAANRRTFLKTAGVAAVLGGAGLGTGALTGTASAAEYTPSPDGEVVVDPGQYQYEAPEVDAGAALVGGGDPGDVELLLEDGTFGGYVEGRLENIVVRGENPEATSGLDLYPGATLDGFIWPDGGQQERDKGLYTPEGGNDRLTIRNSAWAWMVNNGAYVDKPPVTVENCVAANNNIAGIRVGHRDETNNPLSETTYVRNSLITVTDDIQHDSTNSANGRGLRMRQPGNFVVENCWWVYLDANGAGNLIEIEDEAAGSTVEIRNCAFYNDSSAPILNDKSDGQCDVVIENCVLLGDGNHEVGVDYSGSGFVGGGEVTFPLPSEVTGYAAADDIPGVGAGIGPWDGTPQSVPSGGDADQPSEHTLVLHASPDNAGDVDVSVTADGAIAFGGEAESDTDTIVSNDDGTYTATSVGLNPDALDSYRFDGDIVDYSVPDGATVDVSLDGTTTTFAALVGDSTDTQTDSDGTTDGTTDGTDSDGTVDSGTGSTTDDTDSQDDTSLPHLLTVTGTDADDVTKYTFTVSDAVARDVDASTVTGDGTPWDQLEDIAQNGKVIGLVGTGVDAYQFSGGITDITVDGDATIEIERNA